MRDSSQQGSAIIWIMVAIGLFAALNFAFTSSNRTSTSSLTSAQTDAIASEQRDYFNSIRSATKRIKLRGCADHQISYETPAGENVNVNSPSDNSCHVFDVSGGQVVWKDYGLPCISIVNQISPGTLCGESIYAGQLAGFHLFATVASTPPLQYGPAPLVTGATSNSDGVANTDVLVGLGGHPGAEICRALGPEWYMPARDELRLIMSEYYNVGAFNGTFGGYYMSSTELDANRRRSILTGSASTHSGPKTTGSRTRCIRREAI